MTALRPAAVAGTFYPSDPEELARTIDTLLAAAAVTPAAAAPTALIVPHAGYVYSGPVAATAYAGLSAWRDLITRVVVIGPAHRVPVSGLALSSADGFVTPLGVVAIDTVANRVLATCNGAYIDERAHALEHAP